MPLERSVVLALALALAGCRAATSPVQELTGPFWGVAGRTPAERFELAKRSEPELIAFLRRMPKGADLHNHLGGATHDEYLLDSARAAGKRWDVARRTFTDETGEGTVGLDELERSIELLGQYRDSISMRGWMNGGVNGHDHFFRTFARIGAAGRSQDEMIAEVLERNRYQNVPYVELMAAPLSAEVIQQFRLAFHGLDVNDLETSFAPFAALVEDPDVVRALREELDAREQAVGALLGQPVDDYETKVRYVLSLDRVGELERFFVGAVLFMSAIRADSRFVAINMVAPEDAPPRAVSSTRR